MKVSAIGDSELLEHVIERDFEDAVSRIIMQAVSAFEDGLGKVRLSRLLKGRDPGFVLGKGRVSRDFFGRLSLLDMDQLLDFIESLTRLGMMEVEDPEFPRVVLTKKGQRALNRSELISAMIPWPLPPKEVTVPMDEEAYARLKEERNRLAREEGLPPYCVASNRSLVEIVNRGISVMDELPSIQGFGEIRTQKYGGSLLRALSGDKAS